MNGVITERFLYKDQLEPVAKIDGNGDIMELYIYGEKGHVPGYIVKGGQTYRVISDHLGSVRMIVNANTSLRIATAWQAGDIAQEITYNEFGIVLPDSNPGFQPFYYAGGVYDLDTQLVKFGARDYDPATGRWLQKEPLGFNGSMNFYSYAGNDPVNAVDPTGLKLVLVGTATDKAFITLALAKLELYSPTAKQLIKLLEDTDYVYKIALTSDGNEHKRLKKLIYYNPFKTHLRDGSERWHYRPPEIGLAHELIHALHNLAGTRGEYIKGDEYNIEEENKTMGLGRFDLLGFTENIIRAEYNLNEDYQW